MEETTIPPFPDIDLCLESISGVKFTRREIDIIACILGGRAVKKIASLLSIAPRTVETHVRNITGKLSCNSQQSVIDFIETSGNAPLFREYYQSLLTEADFIQKLNDIFKLIRDKPITCRIFGRFDQKSHEHIVHKIEKHFGMVGIKAILDKKGIKQLIKSFLNTSLQERECFIYVTSDISLGQFQAGKNEESLGFPKFLEESIKNPDLFTLVLLSNPKGDIPQELKQLNYLCLDEKESYHLFFFKLLAKIFLDVDFEKIVSDFEKIHSSSSKEFFFIRSKLNNIVRENSYLNLIANNKIRLTSISLVSVIALYAGLSLLKKEVIQSTNQENKLETSQVIRSEMFVPNVDTLLRRPQLIAKIKESFQGQQKIGVVVLSGIGGAGKTTLARSYAKQQDSNLVWEINAETREDLMNSFEDLAYALPQGEKDKKKIEELQAITNSKEREKSLILFIKEKLRNYPNWFLIYDNVEKFSNIQEYFPRDPRVWGIGKIIITTRDGTVANKEFKKINIEELSNEEKFNLFTKILHLEGIVNNEKIKQLEINSFLEKIPSFPLDVSTAACYLESENISYQDYLDRMENNKPEFKQIQENIMNESSGYKKSRYGIITLSLEKIIAEHRDFKELLLLIGLVDSQNIPRDLLERHKGKEVVDSLLYSLKKNSFIVNESSYSSQIGSTFSLHRSTQEIILHYFINKSEELEYKKILPTIINLLQIYVSNELKDNHLKHFNFIRLKLIIKHGESFLAKKKLMKDISKENLLITGYLLQGLGIIYREFGYNL